VFSTSLNPHTVLGVSVQASEQEIKRAYKKLVIRYHPDRYKDDGSAFIRLTKAYNEALDLLKTKPINKTAKTVLKHRDLFNFYQATL
jgi:molecular chaperone DnaJ